MAAGGGHTCLPGYLVASMWACSQCLVGGLLPVWPWCYWGSDKGNQWLLITSYSQLWILFIFWPMFLRILWSQHYLYFLLLMVTNINFFCLQPRLLTLKNICIYFLRVYYGFSNMQMLQFYWLRRIMAYASINLQPPAGGESVWKVLHTKW